MHKYISDKYIKYVYTHIQIYVNTYMKVCVSVYIFPSYTFQCKIPIT